jgi:hypothetical protein
MTISFCQIYLEPGCTFPFSHHFQAWLSERTSALADPSPLFLKKYGADWNLVFNIGAKAKIDAIEVRGPTTFRKTRDVEYFVYLPHPGKPVTVQLECVPTLNHLLDGIRHVLESLAIDVRRLQTAEETLVQEFCADPKLIREWSSW